MAGKRIVILGAARQGTALAKFAAAVGASVLLSDLRSADKLATVLAELDGLGIEFALGRHTPEMLDGADLLAISGGVPADAPMVVEARKRGVAVSNDSQEFIKRAPCAVIGITGSAGKSTTTALAGALLAASGFAVEVCGNIGEPLTGRVDGPPGRIFVVELSSFQLEGIVDFRPRAAALRNLSPDVMKGLRDVPTEEVDVGSTENEERVKNKTDMIVRMMVPFFFMYLLFLGILTMGQQMLSSIIDLG